MRWLKNLFSLNALWASVVLYILIFTVPLLFKADVFRPFTTAVSDFKISDVFYSSILPELEKPEETEIVLINSVMFTDFGQKNISSDNIARFVLQSIEEGATSIGISADLELDSSSENYEMVIKILSEPGVYISQQNLSIDGENYQNITEEYVLESLATLQIRDASFIGSDDRKHKSIRSFYPGEGENRHIAFDLASEYDDNLSEGIELETNEMVINFRGNLEKFTTLEATEFFSGEYEEDILLNKIVLIGPFDITGISDEFSKTYYTPLNESTAGRTFPDMYGITILANIVSMLISDEYLERNSIWVIYLVGFLLAYMNMLVYLAISRWDRKWLEFSALILFVVQSVGIAFMSINFIADQGKYYDLTFMVFVAALSPIIFQIYMDTIRPLARRVYNIFT
jgi:CHASE2 domain-containing sensor protein